MSSQFFERSQEESRDKMWLQASGLSTLHKLAYLVNARCIQYFLSKSAFGQQGLQMLTVQRVFHYLKEPRTYFWLFAIADSLNHQITQRSIVKGHLTQHIEDTPTQCLTLLLQLV